jgi:hypothetical protein
MFALRWIFGLRIRGGGSDCTFLFVGFKYIACARQAFLILVADRSRAACLGAVDVRFLAAAVGHFTSFADLYIHMYTYMMGF